MADAVPYVVRAGQRSVHCRANSLKSDVVNKEVLSDSPVVITHLPFKSEKSEPFNGPNVKLNNILTNFITVISDCLLLLCKTSNYEDY